jgi:hypothetical protein
MLILAPFNIVPKMDFGKVELNGATKKSLLIVIPQNVDVTIKSAIRASTKISTAPRL